jgi:hypothetical protein
VRFSGDVSPSLVREVAATFCEASQGDMKVGNGNDSKREEEYLPWGTRLSFPTSCYVPAFTAP